MIDAILHVLDKVGSARVRPWTWTIAEYEVTVFEDLRNDGRIAEGLLVIDGGAREKIAHLIRGWGQTFGAGSVRYVRNHAKIATIDGAGLRVLLRGLMNLNLNLRFEQVDVTEGGEDFALVRRIESELPTLSGPCQTRGWCGVAHIDQTKAQQMIYLTICRRAATETLHSASTRSELS